MGRDFDASFGGRWLQNLYLEINTHVVGTITKYLILFWEHYWKYRMSSITESVQMFFLQTLHHPQIYLCNMCMYRIWSPPMQTRERQPYGLQEETRMWTPSTNFRPGNDQLQTNPSWVRKETMPSLGSVILIKVMDTMDTNFNTIGGQRSLKYWPLKSLDMQMYASLPVMKREILFNW